MKKRSYTTGIRCLSFIGVLFFLLVCSPRTDTPVFAESQAKGAAMNQAYQLETASLTIPPLDEGAPAVFETASFGLG